MSEFLPRFGKTVLLEAALGIVVLSPLFSAEDVVEIEAPIGLLSAPPSPAEPHNTPSLDDASANKDNFTINFNNVSIIEYIRFVSKITGLNFVLNEEDLQFNVTIVSEDPVTPRNIMAILIQVLRINGLMVLEQENSLLITKATNVSQIATIVSSDLPDARVGNAPIVTRVFRIKNANLNTVASVLRPMLSDSALLEISNETKQLIVTDITTNVDKISSLLASLDAPHTSLEIDSYVAQNVQPPELIALATQILTPFAEGNPIIFVPQIETSTIFIVSTSYLVERILSVLEDLDVPPKSGPLQEKAPAKQNTYLYKIQYRPSEELMESITQLASDLQESRAPSPLSDTLQNAKYLKASNSILFVGDNATLDKLKELLLTLDTPAGSKPARSDFFVYKIQHAPEDAIENALGQMADNLAKTAHPDEALIDAIHSLKWIKETNSLIFSGDAASLKQLSEVLPTFDITPSEVALAQASAPSQFFIYNPQYRTGEELEKSLRDISNNLEDSGLIDTPFLQTVNSMKWVPGSHSLIFTGNPASLQRIETMLKSMDTPHESHQKGEVFLYKLHYVSKGQLQDALAQISENLDHNNPSDQSLQDAIDNMKWIEDSQSFLFRADPPTILRVKDLLANLDTSEGLTGGASSTFFLYTLQSAPGDNILGNLKKVASNLNESGIPNPSLLQTLNSAKWIKDNNSILLTGTASSIEQVRAIIAQFDLPGAPSQPSPSSNKSAFYIYKPLHRSAQEIQSALTDTSKDLETSGLIDPDLLLTLNTMRYVDSTQSLLFTGSPLSLDKVKELLTRIDVASPEPQIQKLGALTFYIYKVQYVTAAQLIASLKGLATDLEKTGAIDKNVVSAIDSLRWIKETNSILFVGDPETLQKVEGMVKKFDLSTLAPSPKGEALPPPGTFVVYTPKFVSGDELISIVEEFEQNLLNSGIADRSLYDTINNLKWIPRTCSILISGDQVSIAKVEDLLKRFDIPSRQPVVAPPNIESIENTSFLIYKLQFHPGDEIVSALKQITTDISHSSASANQNLLNAINSLQWIQVTNSLLASGEADTLAKLKDLVQNIDIPLRQVFIEILILETSLSNIQNFGLQWGGKMQYMNRFAASAGNFPTGSANSTTSSSSGSGAVIPNLIGTGINNVNATTPPSPNNSNIPFVNGFDLGVIGDIIMHKGQSFISLGNLVSALQSDFDSTVVLNPKMITQDNRNSTIFVGTNQPFVGSVITNSTNTNQGSTTSTSVEYRDIGINLSLTPTLGNSDVITLEISTDLSEVISGGSNNQSVQNGVVTGITSSHTTMSTRVHVPDKHFVALSGMIQDTKSRFRSGLPCLGGLPVIGAAFSENDRVNSKNNLIIFLRPHIINTYDEYKAITDHQEQLYKDQAIIPILKEEFDSGLDIVKTPENE